MRYAKIDNFEYTNGKGIGISLYVQGCDFHCKGCFNAETWDFNNGKEWTKDVENNFFQLIDNPHITRVSILGGEPLHDKNIRALYAILSKIKKIHPDKKIWIYTGYVYENIVSKTFNECCSHTQADDYRRSIVTQLCDVLVDGQFQIDKKDPSLAFKGSSNQRIIDVEKSLEANKIVLYEG